MTRRFGFLLLVTAALSFLVGSTLASFNDSRTVGGEITAGSWESETEGCSHGYWKNHPDLWPVAYEPDDSFALYFEDAFPGMTLLGVLEQGGGQLKALGRDTVAALLNAADPDVDYAFTEEEVWGMFNATFPGLNADYQALKDQFGTENERYCPF